MIRSILHPSDFSPPSLTAYVHALRLAVAVHARLNIVHVTPQMSDVHREDFPGVGATLARWGIAPPHSSVQRLEQLGVHVDKIKVRGSDPVAGVLQWLENRYADFIVLATGADTTEHVRRHHAALEIAGNARLPALYLPEGCRGFVDADTGTVFLRRVLVPVDTAPDPQAALRVAAEFVHTLGTGPVQCHIAHAGTREVSAWMRPPARSDCAAWHHETRAGDPVEVVKAMAQEIDADLVVLATAGRHGFLDAWRGSTTERIVRTIDRAVLAVPAD